MKKISNERTNNELGGYDWIMRRVAPNGQVFATEVRFTALELRLGRFGCARNLRLARRILNRYVSITAQP